MYNLFDIQRLINQLFDLIKHASSGTGSASILHTGKLIKLSRYKNQMQQK